MESWLNPQPGQCYEYIVRTNKLVLYCLPEWRKRDLLEPASHVPILPHFPKFTVVVNKAAHQSLGETLYYSTVYTFTTMY